MRAGRGSIQEKGITPLPGDKVDFSITDPKQNEGLLKEFTTGETAWKGLPYPM